MWALSLRPLSIRYGSSVWSSRLWAQIDISWIDLPFQRECLRLWPCGATLTSISQCWWHPRHSAPPFLSSLPLLSRLRSSQWDTLYREPYSTFEGPLPSRSSYVQWPTSLLPWVLNKWAFESQTCSVLRGSQSWGGTVAVWLSAIKCKSTMHGLSVVELFCPVNQE